eukprot:scaffold29934_cov103-Isochrysis_galbana.AAC.7
MDSERVLLGCASSSSCTLRVDACFKWKAASCGTWTCSSRRLSSSRRSSACRSAARLSSVSLCAARLRSSVCRSVRSHFAMLSMLRFTIAWCAGSSLSACFCNRHSCVREWKCSSSLETASFSGRPYGSRRPIYDTADMFSGRSSCRALPRTLCSRGPTRSAGWRADAGAAAVSGSRDDSAGRALYGY